MECDVSDQKHLQFTVINKIVQMPQLLMLSHIAYMQSNALLEKIT